MLILVSAREQQPSGLWEQGSGRGHKETTQKYYYFKSKIVSLDFLLSLSTPLDLEAYTCINKN